MGGGGREEGRKEQKELSQCHLGIASSPSPFPAFDASVYNIEKLGMGLWTRLTQAYLPYKRQS